jgi:hypothetical protein
MVVVGSRKALAISVKNDKTQQKYIFLKIRLTGRGRF